MTTPQEKAQCVSWFIETKSDTQVQRNFRTTYGREPPSRPTICAWHRKLMETGSVLHQEGGGRPSTSEANVEHICEAFESSSNKSVRTAARQLNIPRSTVQKVLHKCLCLYTYKVQIVQAIKPNDRYLSAEFANGMLNRIEEEHGFLNCVVFSDEATFHVSGILNRHNSQIWGSENPHMIREVDLQSSKVNMWFGLMYNNIIGLFLC